MNTGADDKLSKGIAAVREGRRKEARLLLLRVLEQDERNEQAWLWMSRAVETSKLRRFCLEKVLEINPENADARKRLEWLQSREARGPDWTETAVHQADACLTEGNQRAARVILTSIVNCDPNNVQAWYLLSLAVTDDERRQDCLRRVLELDPAHENAITAMGMGAEARSRTYLFRVRPSLVPVLIWGFIGAGVFAALIAVFNASIAGDPFVVSLANLILALVAAAFGVRVFLALLQRLFTRYTLGSEHLLVERGILSRPRKMIPIGRIQGVATRQSLIERPFGIGDVVVESAEEVGVAVLQDLARCKGYTDAILDAVQELSKPD